MDTFIHRRSPLAGGFFVVALLLFTAAPSRAAAPPESAPTTRAVSVFAEGSLRSFFTGGSARDRIVQICVLCMALALFILMKKLAPDATGPQQDGLKNRPTQAAHLPTNDSSDQV